MATEWNERQRLLIDLLADPTDRRTKKLKSEAAGYNQTEVFRLQRRAEFRQAVIERLRELVGVNLPTVYGRLISIVRDGDDRAAIRAADTLLRACGEVPGVTANQIVNVAQRVDASAEKLFAERLREVLERREDGE